jgi:hypothetical protein
MDNYSVKAAEFLPIMLDSLHLDNISEDKRYIPERLKKWNYRYEADIPEPVYFELWWNSFYDAIWAALDDHQMPLRKPTAYHTYLLMGRLDELRDLGFEVTSFSDILHQAFDECLKKIEGAEQKLLDNLSWDAYKTQV